MTLRKRELLVIVRRHGVVAAKVAKNTRMTRREEELRVIVRRHGVVAAEVAKDTNDSQRTRNDSQRRSLWE